MSSDHPFSTVSTVVPSDIVLSPDGSRLYVAGDDGNLRVHDAATGALIATWDVGTRLGAIDISADGSYLMVVEREPLEVVGDSRTVTTYKVSTADGSVQGFPVTMTDGGGPMHDVAILANGDVVLSRTGSAYRLWTLDTDSGIYSGAAPGNTAGVLTASLDRSHVLEAPLNGSGGVLFLYEQDVGIVAGGSRGDSGGPEVTSNWGIQAISEAAGLVVQGPGLSIFDLALDWKFDLTAIRPEVGNNVGLAFDASGENLYILSETSDQIVQVSTETWTIVRRFYVGVDVTGVLDGDFGNRLLLSSDGSYFTVVTGSGVQRVENFALAALPGSAGADSISGTAAAEMIAGLGGDDDLSGGGGHDTIEGGEGADRLSGGEGDDTLLGGAGDDLLAGGAGIDFIYGGDGVDTVDYSADSNPSGAIINLSTNIYVSRGSQPGENIVGPGQALDDSGHFDRISGVENAKGGQFADWIIGNAGANRFDGGAGNDTLEGGNGDDQLFGDAGHDRLTGGAGIDLLVAGEGNDFLIGSAGADEMRGGIGNDSYNVDNVGDVVVELAGEGTDRIDTALAVYSLAGLAHVEDLAALSAIAHDFRGNSANNVITGGAGNDFLRLQDGGDDNAVGGLGNDVFLFGGALTSADQVNGGAGTDQIAIQGDYWGANALTLGSNISQIENLAILPGDEIGFGDPGTNFYDYKISVTDWAVGYQVQLVVDANRLRAGEDLTFDGSAELDGSFFIFGGNGVDLLTGGSKNDVFMFGAAGQWGANDVIVGGAGIDQLGLRGNYALTFGAGQLIGIESIGVVSAHDTRYGALGSSYSYDLTMVDGNVASGAQMTVDAGLLRGGEHFRFDGSAELDGSFRAFGGLNGDLLVGSRNNDIIQGNGGADSLVGGAGSDIFRYVFAADSTATYSDHILDFAAGSDRIDLSRIDANSLAAGDQAFSFIGSNAFGGSGAGSAGQLRAYQSGGNWFVEGDTDGDGNADLVIQLTVTGGQLSQADFLP